MGKEAILTDETIKSIIQSRKYIKDSIDLNHMQLSEDGRFRKKKYELVCDEYDCKIVIRQNTDRPDNFSIILIYKDISKGEIPIIRFNGNHGSHRNRIENETINGPHIHIMTERYQLHSTHPDGFAEPANGYKDLEGAFKLFLERVNISDIKLKDTKKLEDFQ
jgi:hypothetical protein